MNNIVESWVIYYDSSNVSSNTPIIYYAQKFNDLTPTKQRVTSTSLEVIRSMLALKGLAGHKNTYKNDPDVIECWI